MIEKASDAAAINRQSIVVQVAAILRDRITSGELPPGAPLKEKPLADSFSVSRNTIREALGLLASDGIVVHHPYRGAAVTEINRDDVREIFQLRRFLETNAIDATKTADPQLLTDLKSRVDDLRSLSNDADWRDIVQADLEIHRTLVHGIGNSRFTRIFDNIVTELRLLILIANTEDKENPASLAAQHGELVDLLTSGDRAKCKKRLLSHLDDAERLLLDYLARFPVD